MKYGQVKVSKIRGAYNALRKAIRSHDNEATESALDRYEPWADAIFSMVDDLEEWNATQAETIKTLWMKNSDLTREQMALRDRAEKQQRMIDWMRRRISELEDPRSKAEQHFKDQDE